MGFDIIGREPSSKIGAHFGVTVDGWTPLADYIIETVPEIAAKCRHWYYNDGDGLDAPEAKTLANSLEAEIASGRCMAYARARRTRMVAFQAQIAALPDQPCSACAGTGLHVISKSDLEGPFPVEAPLGSEVSCCRCEGIGTVRPDDPNKYRNTLTPNLVREFVGFLRDCGGFSIR
jgi:hypothetical protein